VEVEAAAQVKAINSAFDVAYQYLDAQSIVDGRSVGRLDYAPNHRVYLRGRTQQGIVFAELFALYVGQRFDPGFNVDPETGQQTTRVSLEPYLVANARIGANVYKGLSVSLLGNNIFNSSFQEVHGFPAQGMSAFAEVRYQY
jgi:hemoglobin/transferrin/lactoferrin receptor protein